MSKPILIVGTDTNMFQHSLHTPGAPPTAADPFSESVLDFGGRVDKNGGSVNQALIEAHFRTSTKQHDMIFALKNIFIYMFDDFEISYSTDVQATFNNFYRHIATKDLSMLCFGSNLTPNGKLRDQSTMGSYNLPSWTGVDGRHVPDYVNITIHPQLSYTIDNSMKMNIKTKRYWKISIKSYEYGPYDFSTEKCTPVTKQRVISERIQNISSAKLMRERTDMARADKITILAEWYTNMSGFAKVYMTHYHYLQNDNNPLTQLRPLLLTKECEGEECIVLPTLFEAQTQVQNTNASPGHTDIIICFLYFAKIPMVLVNSTVLSVSIF